MQVQLGNETLIVIICEDEDDPDHVCDDPDHVRDGPDHVRDDPDNVRDDPDHVRDDHQTQHHTNRDEILMMMLTTAMMITIKPEFHNSMTADLRRSKSFVRSKPLEEI